MQIEIGPPGVRGVQTLMHVGADGLGNPDAPGVVRLAELAGVGMFLYGHFRGNPDVREIGLIVGLVALAGDLLMR